MRLAILGAGKLGMAVARLASGAGVDVAIARSGDPSSIAMIVDVLAPGARAVTPAEAVASSDLVLLAIPLRKLDSVDAVALRGKVVIDAMNYWWETDGRDSEWARAEPSSSELVASRLPGVRVVKAFNHVGYHDLADQWRPGGGTGRLAMALASDDPEAVDLVAGLVDRLGFDPLPLPTLRAGRALEPGHPAFGAALPLEELRAVVGD